MCLFQLCYMKTSNIWMLLFIIGDVDHLKHIRLGLVVR